MSTEVLEKEIKEIGGHTYRVVKLPFKKGRRLGVRLLKNYTPVLDAFADRFPSMSGGSLEDMKIAELLPSVTSAFSTLVDRLSEEELEDMTDTLSEFSELKTEDGWVPLKPQMEFHFSGRYGDYMKWILFALQANFGNFFGGSGSIKEAFLRAAKKKKDWESMAKAGSE